MVRTISLILMVLIVLGTIVGTIIVYAYLHNQFCDYQGHAVIDEGVLDSE